ncbi:ATP-binding cassette domain-containing protein, partial [Bifidobacterium adolescentis]|nr:ATP-binding cassette domain-containing protein [Bifidobacterium adolescentis]
MEHEFTGAEAENVTFAYGEEVILDNYSLKLQPGKITGIHGASGSGKSTLLKLLMRFWDVQGGSMSVDGTDVR